MLLYLKHVPRNWSYTNYGYYKGAENFTRGAAVLILLPLLKHYTSFRDTTLIMAGLMSKIIAMVLLGLAQSTWAIFLGKLCLCLFNLRMDSLVLKMLLRIDSCIANFCFMHNLLVMHSLHF